MSDNEQRLHLSATAAWAEGWEERGAIDNTFSSSLLFQNTTERGLTYRIVQARPQQGYLIAHKLNLATVRGVVVEPVKSSGRLTVFWNKYHMKRLSQ